jgi:hypothetical protein
MRSITGNSKAKGNDRIIPQARTAWFTVKEREFYNSRK